MVIWTEFVEVLLNIMHYFTGVFGSTGLIILLFSLVIRFAFLPLSVKLAQRSKERQELLEALKPALQRIKQTHAHKPEIVAHKTMELYKKNGIKIVDSLGITGFFLQAPFFIGMFSAVSRIIAPSQHFLWISNLARPDLLLTLIAAILTWVSSVVAPKSSGQGGAFIVWMPVIMTLVFLWKLSAGIGLYWIASSIVSIFQAVIMRYTTNNNGSVVVTV